MAANGDAAGVAMAHESTKIPIMETRGGGINPGLQAVGCHHRLKDHADHQGIADIRQHTADDQKHGAEDKRAPYR